MRVIINGAGIAGPTLPFLRFSLFYLFSSVSLRFLALYLSAPFSFGGGPPEWRVSYKPANLQKRTDLSWSRRSRSVHNVTSSAT